MDLRFLSSPCEEQRCTPSPQKNTLACGGGEGDPVAGSLEDRDEKSQKLQEEQKC